MKKILICLVVLTALVSFYKAQRVTGSPLSSQVDLGSHATIDDNNELILGNDSDYSIVYDSSADELQIRVGSDNVSPEDSSDGITMDTNRVVTIKNDITVTDDINVGNTSSVIDYDSTNANIDISTSVVVTGDLTATNINGIFDGTLEMTYTAFTSSDAAITTSQFGFIDIQYATCTVNLPAVSGTAGKSYIIKHSTTSTGVVTIDGNGSETIDGSATNTDLDTANDCLTIFSTGSAWKIIQRYIQ